MKPQKRCEYCRRMFDPYPARYDTQDACSRSMCQKQRRRATNKACYRANGYDNDNRWEKNKDWREKYGREYQRGYRKEHPAYVQENRRKQRFRNRERGKIVKQDVWKSLHTGKLLRIHVLERDCKVRRIRLLSL